MANFRWTEAKANAAQWFAEGHMSARKVAEQLGVSPETVNKWRRNPEFIAKVEEIIAELEAEIRTRGIARQLLRVDALQDRWERMRQVIAERSVAPEMQDVAGGQTGLLVRTFKVVGQGPEAHAVPEFAVDTGLLKELREHEKQAAQELGQWTEKREINGNVAGSVEIKPIDYRAIVAPLLSDASIE